MTDQDPSIRGYQVLVSSEVRTHEEAHEIARQIGDVAGAGADVKVVPIFHDERNSPELTPELMGMLDMPVEELVSLPKDATPTQRTVRTRRVNALQREGFYTVRDLVVMGTDEIDRATHLGRASREYVQALLQQRGVALQPDRANIHTIAAVCHSLDQVTAAVLGEFRLVRGSTYQSVADVVDMSPADLAKTLSERMLYDRSPEVVRRYARNLIKQARQFKDDFVAAKAAQSPTVR